MSKKHKKLRIPIRVVDTTTDSTMFNAATHYKKADENRREFTQKNTSENAWMGDKIPLITNEEDVTTSSYRTVGMILGAIALALIVIVLGVRAGIRMIEDPKPKIVKYYHTKLVDVKTGIIFFNDNMDTTYKVGDMFLLDNEGEIISGFGAYNERKAIIVERIPMYK